MDSSKILAGNEECSSSESGWTMYIASSPDSTHDHPDNLEQEEEEEEEEDDDDDDISLGKRVPEKDDRDMDSDDSMASDASSGPSNQKRYSFENAISPLGHARKSNAKRKPFDEEQKHHERNSKGDKDGSRHGDDRFKKT